MKKSILFIAALIIISSDFIAQGSVQDQNKQKTTQYQNKDANNTKRNPHKDSTKSTSRRNNEEMRKMDNYKNTQPAGPGKSEQEHMDTTINNHR